MKCQIVLLPFFLFFSLVSAGQNMQWSRNFGGSEQDMAFSIEKTSGDGRIIAGETYSSDGDVANNNGSSDAWILELDQSGDIEWKDCYGGSNTETAKAIEKTSDGGFIVTGESWSSDGDISGTNKGGSDVWVFKIDSNGTLEWEENYGGSGNDRSNDIQQTMDGGFIIAGHSLSSDGDLSGNNGGSDIWVLKLGPSGSIEWQENYGGSDAEEGYAVEQGPGGAYFVAGYAASSNGDLSGQKGNGDFWVLKLGQNGQILWERNYGGSEYEVARSIEEGTNSGYVVAGTSRSSDEDVSGNNGNTDFWVLKIDSSGSIEWEGNYGGSSMDEVRAVRKSSSWGYIVVGESWSSDMDVSGNKGSGDVWLLELDPQGQIEWEKNFGGSSGEVAESVLPTDNGNYIVAGQSWSTDGDISSNNGVRDHWIFSVDDPTSLREVERGIDRIELFPVPTQGRTHVQLGEFKEEVSIEVYDINGRRVKSENFEGVEEFRFDLDVHPGPYLIEIRSDDGERRTKKVIKE